MPDLRIVAALGCIAACLAAHAATPRVATGQGHTLAVDAQGRVLALSRRAFEALTTEQRDRIERSARLLPLDVPTIELAGGSVRCMLAGVHLDPRPGLVEPHAALVDDAAAVSVVE